MATTTPNIHDALVKAGVDEDAATAIAQRIERRVGPSAMSILIAATLAGFGWVKSDISDLRTEFRTELKSETSQLRTEIAANRDRIDSVSERLTRIETLLEERLPARR